MADLLVEKPLEALQRCMDARTAAQGPLVISETPSDWGLKSMVEEALQADPRLRESIPLLTEASFRRGHLKNHQLVRYRGVPSAAGGGDE